MSKLYRTIVLFVLLTGCQVSEADTIITPPANYTPGPTPDVSDIAQDYPRVDGSTSTYPLQELVACKILNVTCIWDELFGERRLFVDIGATPAQNAEKINSIQHTSTHDAYMNLINENVDFILVARLPSDDEIQAARARHVTLDVHPIALDAFVFLAHQDNPVQSLTLGQIRGIYTGEIRDWSELGGTMGKINAYQRDPNSGSQELMKDLVMKGKPMIEAPDMMFETMIGPINAIRDDPLGIGYSVFYYVTFMQPDENIKLLGIEGTSPNSVTIADRDYPLVTEVYAVVRADLPPESSAIMLRDWFLTDAGQETVKESGYVRIR